MKIKGILHKIEPVQQVKESLRVRYFVLKVIDAHVYTNHIPFQLYNDKVSMLDSLSVGQEVTVYFDIRSRERHDATNQIKRDYFMNLIASHVGKDIYQNKAIRNSYKAKEKSDKMDNDFNKRMKRENDFE